MCLNGSVLTVADNPVLVGVVSLEDRLLPEEEKEDGEILNFRTGLSRYCWGYM